MGLGIAEVDQEPVAHITGEIAVEAADLLGAGLLIGQDHLAQVFGVEFLGERGGAYQITEQHRQLPPLGFGRCRARLLSGVRLGVATLVPLGRLPGRLGFALSLSALSRRPRGQRAPTLATESKPRGVLKVTVRAAQRQRGGTPAAEIHSLRVLEATARAAHSASLLLRAPRGKENSEPARFDNCLPLPR